MNTLYKLLDRLESVMMDGIPIPFLPYSLMNQDKLIVLLDKIQTAIPEEIQRAEQILAQQDEIQYDCHRKVQQMMHEARVEADRMLSESELMNALHLEAERIRQQVTAEMEALRQKTFEEVAALKQKTLEEAQLVRTSADEYAETVLRSLSKNLDEFQHVARSATKSLKKVQFEAHHHPGEPKIHERRDPKALLDTKGRPAGYLSDPLDVVFPERQEALTARVS